MFDDHGLESRKTGDSIAIVGGELFNKGAQAMTLTVVNQMAERFPEKDIYLLSGRDYERDQKEKNRYAFSILPWDAEVQLSLLSPGLDIVNTESYSKRERETVRKVFSNCSMLIDISGLALSSQMGAAASFIYLTNIVLSKEYDVPMYVLPQSIGPFDFSAGKKIVLNPLLQTYLSYPEVICPREKAGAVALESYTRSNVQQEFDIVLQTEGYELDNVFASEPNLDLKKIDTEAVGIVPNSRVFERTYPKELYKLYEAVIDELLESGKTIYILRHSVEDLDLCRNIKQLNDNDNIHLFEEDLSAPELEHIINQLEFLIGSRYHSLVHAYKHGVPVIAIGWAIKYEELLDEFGQSQYFFEGREQIDVEIFVDSVSRMINEWESETETILEKLDEVRQNDLFSRLFQN
jgi:colanic acid/amylovoran biosynthesis protein